MKKSFCKIVAILSCCAMLFSTAACGRHGKRSDTELLIFTYTGNEYDSVKKDAVWEAIEEATGFDISFQGASTANYLEKLNPKMNELDFPDIIWVDNSSQSFINWASPEQDLIWNLDELMLGNEDRYPYLTKLIYSDQYKNISYYDGGHYFVPNVNTATAWAIYYRADWLKEIGFVDENGNAKAPVTLDEFEQVMEGFTAKNKFGNQQTWGISPNTDAFYTNSLYGAFDVTPDWDIDEKGSVSYMYTNEKIKPYLEWMHAMYEKGWIQPTFNENKAFQDREHWYSGKVGCIMTNGEAHMEWVVGKLMEANPKAEVIVGPPLKGTGNVSARTKCVLGVKDSQGFSNWGGYYGGYAIPKDFENTEKAYNILDFLEYMVSPEGSMTRLYGVKGVHYNIVDGKIAIDTEQRESERVSYFAEVTEADGETSLSGLHKIGSLFGYSVDWDEYERSGDIVVGTDIGALYPAYEELVRPALEYAKILKTSKLLNVTSFPSTIATKLAEIEDISNSYMNPVILGDKNLESDWTAMLNDCEKAGYGDVRKIIAEVSRELGIIG